MKMSIWWLCRSGTRLRSQTTRGSPPTKLKGARCYDASMPDQEPGLAPPAALTDTSITELELLKLRCTLSWNWFEFHARQRMSMFNYFILTTGILVNGYVAAAKDEYLSILLAVTFLGMWQALTFFMIDVRSRQLIGYGEDVLEKIERDTVFPDGFTSVETRPGLSLGLLRRDKNFREGKVTGLRWLKKMKTWMWGMHGFVFLGSLVAFINILVKMLRGHFLFPLK